MEITVSEKDKSLFVRSTEIASHFGKRHSHVLQDISRLVRQTESHSRKSGSEFFIETSFVNERKREYREYLMTRDGFSLLAMGFTGSEALVWKLKYIDAFNQMEKALTEKREGVMAALSEAIALMESDKDRASAHGKALSKWRSIRKQHISDIKDMHSRAQILLNFA